jgi:hypothetical protein
MHLKGFARLQLALAFGVIVGLAGFTASASTPAASAAGTGSARVTFTKWVTDFPNMTGFVGGAVGKGDFAGEVLSADPSVANGNVTVIDALYHFKGGSHSLTAAVHVTMFNGHAFIYGVVTEGWREGAFVWGSYRVIGCAQAADGTCYQGALRIAGS